MQEALKRIYTTFADTEFQEFAHEQLSIDNDYERIKHLFEKEPVRVPGREKLGIRMLQAIASPFFSEFKASYHWHRSLPDTSIVRWDFLSVGCLLRVEMVFKETDDAYELYCKATPRIFSYGYQGKKLPILSRELFPEQ